MDRNALIAKYGEPDVKNMTNGQIIKIFKDSQKVAITAAIWVLTWTDQSNTISPHVLRSKLLRVVQKAGKLRGEALQRFFKDLFIFPNASSATVEPTEIPGASAQPDPPQPSPPRPTFSQTILLKWLTPKKKLNTTEHELAKKERHVEVLDKKIKALKEQIVEQTKINSQYSLKNMKRREGRSAAMKLSLKASRDRYRSDANKAIRKNLDLKQHLKLRMEKNKKLEKKCRMQRKKIDSLTSKKASCMKIKKPKGKMSKEYCDMRERQDIIIFNHHDEPEKQFLKTKKDTGSGNEFIEKMRFCVMELAGLEVATGKIGPVIETVGTLCNVQFSHLPSRMACQRIVDEGHVVAKAFIKDTVLKKSKSFRLHKDGTTRKKVKILDTSIQTDSGESFCLGWSSVASETGQAIANEAKEKLGELVESETSDREEGLKDLLEKLVYFMNDRAANEKKSSRLLEEWREKCLREYGNENIKGVHHLYCAAHVLLGFHSYVMNEIKVIYESSEYKHPVTVLLKDASDLFGPVGDHRGVRNQWEAFCMERNFKSVIKPYKDNRFNGLFEVAAQVFHHHDDFLHILTSLNSLNAKQARLTKALKNSKLILILECLAVLFHKVTGPFWSMVTTRSMNYHGLSTRFQDIVCSLQKSIDDPNFLLEPNSFSCLKFPTSSPETKEKLPTILRPDMKEILSKMCNAILTTCKVQLADFLEGGIYGTQDGIQDLCKTASLTNLICERNFGHLDASQKRRPNSSLHHHSSVMLLKQTRKRMREWFISLPEKEKEGLWKKARRDGSQLRKKHRDQDREAILDSLRTLKLQKKIPVLGDLKQGQMVAIACEDAWYPARRSKHSRSRSPRPKVGGSKVFQKFREMEEHTKSRRPIDKLPKKPASHARVKLGPWTPAEEEKFVVSVLTIGPGKWQEVKEDIQAVRSTMQLKDKWRNIPKSRIQSIAREHGLSTAFKASA